ncbi:hypothetical protein J0S82_017903 [Galemys pyrenaicus]|uniref:Uncharacterized protein n=1 Tax=Galemys pyrenaicus TaxID=202257 RepID=A0A8J5ZZ73_GALPY|nr:hypothetical protein J0S82_017903 [Galemys pyrenaicus]
MRGLTDRTNRTDSTDKQWQQQQQRKRSSREGEMHQGLGGLPASWPPGTHACHVVAVTALILESKKLTMLLTVIWVLHQGNFPTPVGESLIRSTLVSPTWRLALPLLLLHLVLPSLAFGKLLLAAVVLPQQWAYGYL